MRLSGVDVTTPGLGECINGAILYDETIRQRKEDGTPFVKAITDAGIIPGIKVDIGAKDMAGHPAEKITEGLDGLRDRIASTSSDRQRRGHHRHRPGRRSWLTGTLRCPLWDGRQADRCDTAWRSGTPAARGTRRRRWTKDRGARMKDTAIATNRGVVVSVRGSVVDIRFDEHLPPIYSVLRAGDGQSKSSSKCWRSAMRITCAG